MPKQKKKIKKLIVKGMVTPAPVHHQAPVDTRDAGNSKMNYAFGGIVAVIVAVLILLWFTGDFAGRKEERILPQSDELKTETLYEPEETAPAPEPSLDFTESQYGIEMIYVRGGMFLMGCAPDHMDDCYEYEEPARMTNTDDFYIGKYEVTQAQWNAVMGGNPSHYKGDNLPVDNVSWNEAGEFIRKLNAATGKTYRLPMEKEWEYAARGGMKSRGYNYSGSNDVEEVAWYVDNSELRPHPVGTKKTNELGIHDMSGNAWEWISDLYGENDDAGRTNSADPGRDTFRVIRGGGWGSFARGVLVSNYYNNGSGNRYNILGFRLACDYVP
jgi:formylglycine-generating enzyme required for sulfatase activity